MSVALLEKLEKQPDYSFTWNVDNPYYFKPVGLMAAPISGLDGPVTYVPVAPAVPVAPVPVAPVPVEYVRPLKDRMIALLEKADAAITIHGWVRGSYYRPDKGFCLYGALMFALTGVKPISTSANLMMSQSDHGAFYAVLSVLSSEIAKATAGTFSDVPSWNDRDGRTVEDVHLLVKKGIEYVRANYR